MSTKRWLVERRRDEFETFGALYFRVESGALVFRDAREERVYALAPGEWISVIEDSE